MTLVAVLDAIADRLAAAVGGGVRVGDAAPTGGNELPALTLSAAEITERLVGIGRIPRGTRTGALAVEVDVDLADPVVDLGGEMLTLLSADRRTLTLPNGPLVRADGVGERPFTGADLQVSDGAPFTVVDSEPAGRQVRPGPADGTLLFGTALAQTGTLTVTHHIGQWDVVVSRFQGLLTIAVAATSADAVRALSRQVAGALHTAHPVIRLVPRSWGLVHAEQVGDTDAAGQLLGYEFDAELESPILPAGGGVISAITAAVHNDEAVESFTIARQGGTA